MFKFLCIDDHPILCLSVEVLLRKRFSGAVVQSSINRKYILDLIRKDNFDIVILDLNIPDLDSFQLVKEIFMLCPNQKILIFSTNSEVIFGKKLIRMGVRGYINKECSSDEFLLAVDRILNNRMYYSEALTDILNEQVIYNKPDNVFTTLSRRELDLLRYLLIGKSLSEISDILNLHTSTVGTHKKRLFEKLNVNSLVELIKLVELYDFKLSD